MLAFGRRTGSEVLLEAPPQEDPEVYGGPYQPIDGAVSEWEPGAASLQRCAPAMPRL